ncbi:hypothetical protein [Pantoea sp. SS70]|uniref:hypothetical protein n=1 Tax=Pantoea sp. SS70 TaxID=3024247 RepID=UPI00245295B2|nr:hypothetical protein [Pantoea sp. SS70]WGK59988.1 hypothetical protein PO881_23765 [Pantoea sp. SS70]
MTLTDITDAMLSSQEGYALLVTDSVEFSINRSLKDDEILRLSSIIENAVADAVRQLKESGPGA